MTPRQFAAAVRADEKWVQNTARLLGRRLRYDAATARRLALVRVLNQEFGVPLVRADRMAAAAIAAGQAERVVRVAESDDASAHIAIDLGRFDESFSAALSSALAFQGPRRRGRPVARSRRGNALARARRYGVDIGLLRANLALSPHQRLAQLDENMAFLAAAKRIVPTRRRRGKAKGA